MNEQERRNHAAFIEEMERVSSHLNSPKPDAGSFLGALMPWQQALLKRIAVMGEDERLIIAMPRRSAPAEALVYKIVLSAQEQVVTNDQLLRIEEQLAHPVQWTPPS